MYSNHNSFAGGFGRSQAEVCEQMYRWGRRSLLTRCFSGQPQIEP
jgi:hypothetical protein